MMSSERFTQSTTEGPNLDFRSEMLLPGDCLRISTEERVVLGQGLRMAADHSVLSSVAGRTRCRPHPQKGTAVYSTETARKQYVPRVGDQVVGIIEDRGGDFYRVNIRAGAPALLGRLDFDGATKRNKPELSRGDVVYCRVALAERGLDTQVTCVSSSSIKKDWASGEAVYGAQAGGLVVQLPLQAARALLRAESPLLSALGRHLAYEVAVGVNGVVWADARRPEDLVLVRTALLSARVLEEAQAVALVDELARAGAGNKDKK